MPHGLAIGLFITIGVVAVVMIWQGLTAAGNPNPLAPHTDSTVAVLYIGVLVFREGLECILALAAITASMVRSGQAYQHPVAGPVLQ